MPNPSWTSRLLGFFVLLLAAARALAMISVGYLSPKEAAELGITMKHRPNGDAGELVWIEFKKVGFLSALTYTEFQMVDERGRHQVSARLEPRAVNHPQPPDVVTISFSAAPAALDRCAFQIVAYGSNRGDVGYVLKVKDYLDLAKIAKASKDREGMR